MKRKLLIILVALVAIGGAAGAALYHAYPIQVSMFAGLTRNYILSWNAPAGTTTTESNPTYKGGVAAASLLPADPRPASSGDEEWPMYNRTLASERHSPLDQINTRNVGKLKILCTYDLGELAAFESGLI